MDKEELEEFYEENKYSRIMDLSITLEDLFKMISLSINVHIKVSLK